MERSVIRERCASSIAVPDYAALHPGYLLALQTASIVPAARTLLPLPAGERELAVQANLACADSLHRSRDASAPGFCAVSPRQGQGESPAKSLRGVAERREAHPAIRAMQP